MLESLSSLRMFASLRPWPWMMKTELLGLGCDPCFPTLSTERNILGSQEILKEHFRMCSQHIFPCVFRNAYSFDRLVTICEHTQGHVFGAYPLLLLDADSMSESWSKAIKIIDFATKKEIRVLKHVPQDNGDEVHRDETWNIAQSDQITSWASAKQKLRVCRLHRRPYQKVRREKSHQFRWRSLDHTKAEDLASIPCSINLNKYYDRRKFRSETSDNMDSWKAEVRRVRREKLRRKKMQMREKVGKSRFTVFFQWFVAPEGRKVGSLKRRVRTQLARWEMKKCTPLWREAHFQVKMYKTHHSRTTFGSSDVEKVHAVVARSTFPSQNVQNTTCSDHFWKLRCRKSARRCGAKHISKSKCTKHTILGPLLEVEMSKKCTPLWREAHFQVKMYKTPHARTTFGGSDVEKVSKKCTPLWREAHFEVKRVKNWGFWAFFDVKMSKK